jgi:hypothetical protein
VEKWAEGGNVYENKGGYSLKAGMYMKTGMLMFLGRDQPNSTVRQTVPP